MRSRRLRVAHITHTSHHYQNDLVYMGTPRISMVTIPSSIAATAIAYGLDKKSKTESRALLLPFSASPPALSLAHSCIEQRPGLLESLDSMRPRHLAKPEAKSSWLIRLHCQCSPVTFVVLPRLKTKVFRNVSQGVQIIM